MEASFECATFEQLAAMLAPIQNLPFVVLRIKFTMEYTIVEGPTSAPTVGAPGAVAITVVPEPEPANGKAEDRTKVALQVLTDLLKDTPHGVDPVRLKEALEEKKVDDVDSLLNDMAREGSIESVVKYGKQKILLPKPKKSKNTFNEKPSPVVLLKEKGWYIRGKEHLQVDKTRPALAYLVLDKKGEKQVRYRIGKPLKGNNPYVTEEQVKALVEEFGIGPDHAKPVPGSASEEQVTEPDGTVEEAYPGEHLPDDMAVYVMCCKDGEILGKVKADRFSYHGAQSIAWAHISERHGGNRSDVKFEMVEPDKLEEWRSRHPAPESEEKRAPV